nr:putative late blight resistance protein homolog R1A-3 [Coffea arabica]XP_027073643.1 putative late blight resistance protein homolog R1A-3 [Coffea arabica]
MEIPSSSNTSFFEFALHDYLRSHHISSSTSTSCFDLALDYLCKLEESVHFWHFDITDLKETIRFLKTIFLYVKKCRRRRNCEAVLEHDQDDKGKTLLKQDQEDKGKALLEHDQEDTGNILSERLSHSTICFRIQDMVINIVHDLESAYLLYEHSDESDRKRIAESAMSGSLANIWPFLRTNIKESCTVIFDYYPPEDPQLVVDLIASLLEPLGHPLIELEDTMRHELQLLRSLIRVAIMRGVECTQFTDLLTHATVVVEYAIFECCFDSDEEQVPSQTDSEIYESMDEDIDPPDPQVRETCMHVLAASKKQSRSSYALAFEQKEHRVLVELIDSLLDYLTDLLGSCASFQVLVKDQMLKLHQGVKYLSILLEEEEKLGDEIKDLIGVVVHDAGTLIFSLSVNEIKEGFPKETDLVLFHLYKVLKYMMAELGHNYPLASPHSLFNYPRSNELGCIDFFLKNLKELARCDEVDDSIVFILNRIQMVQDDLVFLRSFLENIKEQRYHTEKLQAFWSRAMEAAYKAELLIDLILVGDKCEDSLYAVARHIKLLKTEALEIYNGQTRTVNKTFIHIPSQLAAAIHNEDLVGLDDAVETITHRLIRGSKQLDIIPIVGMPGLGKTTLANKVYAAPSVRLHFHVRGWCSVSQTCSKHSLLVQLLCSLYSKSPHEYLKKDENDLAKKLRQVLLRSRYLLILDDLWDIEAWNLLEKLLPNDANGSKILLTSRFQNLSSQFKPDSNPYHLRPLTDEESWTLLQKKLFDKEGCPPTLSEVGFQIAKTCRGLPLTVVLVAGILATTAQDRWEEVAKSLSSIVLDNEYCMKTLELSYSHLPDYLKPCLLYFGAFREDEVIHVRRLLRLWISEGFVQQAEGKSLEEVAYDYLVALINTSLVVVTDQRTTRSAKACQLHDLVHEFCVEKAKEESFLHIIRCWKGPFCLAEPSSHHRVWIQSSWELKTWELMLIFPNLRCLLLFGYHAFDCEEKPSRILLPKLLRVLDLGDWGFGESFPMEVLLLVHLRYLALCGITSIPSAIVKLSRLETLIVKHPESNIVLPNTIWDIRTLSYLRTIYGKRGFIFAVGNLEVSPDLDHLDTLNLAIDPLSQNLQKLLTKLPSIRRLKCMRDDESRDDESREATRNCDEILVFDCLTQLESLQLIGFRGYGFNFPLNLKKLSLSENCQPWSEISTIGKLPNLIVLKLHDSSFIGEEWVMKEGEFPNLRVLELLRLDIRNWTASSDDFCHLEKLVVRHCKKLEEVPACLGECPTLEMIQVENCSESLANSIKQIQQEQMDSGNEVLKIIIENCCDDTLILSKE